MQRVSRSSVNIHLNVAAIRGPLYHFHWDWKAKADSYSAASSTASPLWICVTFATNNFFGAIGFWRVFTVATKTQFVFGFDLRNGVSCSTGLTFSEIGYALQLLHRLQCTLVFSIASSMSQALVNVSFLSDSRGLRMQSSTIPTTISSLCMFSNISPISQCLLILKICSKIGNWLTWLLAAYIKVESLNCDGKCWLTVLF